MQFKDISIKNFRNFENIKVDLTNKNVFFGMNDVGKTNFLYNRLLFPFEYKVSKEALIEDSKYVRGAAKK